jgi:hypothetical protein
MGHCTTGFGRIGSGRGSLYMTGSISGIRVFSSTGAGGGAVTG